MRTRRIGALLATLVAVGTLAWSLHASSTQGVRSAGHTLDARALATGDHTLARDAALPQPSAKASTAGARARAHPGPEITPGAVLLVLALAVALAFLHTVGSAAHRVARRRPRARQAPRGPPELLLT